MTVATTIPAVAPGDRRPRFNEEDLGAVPVVVDEINTLVDGIIGVESVGLESPANDTIGVEEG